MANIISRTAHSLKDGTFKKKLEKRRYYFKKRIFKRFDWILWYLGNAPWQCRVKAWYLRLQGAKVGKCLYLERNVIIKHPEFLTLGDHVGISTGCIITCMGGVTIGDYAGLGYGCRVLSSNHVVPPIGEHFRYAGHTHAPVHLKTGSWLAANTVVLPGITVGEGAVACACSLIANNVPDYAYVGGVPAKFMMYRGGYKPPQAD